MRANMTFNFKNFINFSEHNYIGDGELENEPAFSWFEIDKRYTFTKEEVLSGKADNLFLTPDSRKSLYGTPSKLLKRLLIDIYSNNLTPVEKRRGWFKQFYKPTIEDNTYNLNINNLVDENYDIFEKEYLALCNQYKFTPNTKPVRDFILVWRSKQTLVNI